MADKKKASPAPRAEVEVLVEGHTHRGQAVCKGGRIRLTERQIKRMGDRVRRVGGPQ